MQVRPQAIALRAELDASEWIAVDRVRHLLKFPDADSGLDGSGVRVAVLDTGIDEDHLDLRPRIASTSRSFDALDSRLIDEVGHGTHVAGIIAGSGAASAGRYAGVAPGAEILAMRVSTSDRAYSDTVAEAVLAAVDEGADIINYSAGSVAGSMPPPWVWPVRRTALELALAHASQAGVICVVAAGNDGPFGATVSPPGIRREMLCVGAMGFDGVVSEGSSRGPAYLDPSLPKGGQARYDSLLPGSAKAAPYLKPDLVAPGGQFPSAWSAVTPLRRHLVALSVYEDGIVSCRAKYGKTPGLAGSRSDSPYTMWPGTSMATAVISGMAALAIQYAATLGLDWGRNRAESVRNLLCKAARRLAAGSSEDFGNGAPLWPAVAGLIEDCVDSGDKREAVLRGPQLEVLEGEG